METPPSSFAREETPRDVRKAGLRVVAGSLGILVLMRLFVWAQISFWSDGFTLPGIVFVLPPVVAAFGLTQVITGRNSGFWRLPLVIILAIVGIGLTFTLLIPRGYDLTY